MLLGTFLARYEGRFKEVIGHQVQSFWFVALCLSYVYLHRTYPRSIFPKESSLPGSYSSL